MKALDPCNAGGPCKRPCKRPGECGDKCLYVDHGPAPAREPECSHGIAASGSCYECPAKDEIEALTNERGAVYGDPKDDFGRVAHMAQAIATCPDPLVKHVLYMLLVKISRLVHTPGHVDSWKDIAGYARCGEKVT